MKKEVNEFLKETLYSEVLSNGLRVFLLPKEEYSNVFAAFATHFGAVNSLTKINDIIIPRGVAHFLEHRLFDTPQGDVVDLFSASGADVNAYTTYDRTVYYFSATQEIQANINLLLDFVQTCVMSEEAVEKEKDIICEEIAMYADYPSSKLYRGILDNMYYNHEIKNEVAGDEESVRSTSYKVLKLAHQTFYHPSNMLLVVCGKFNVDEMMKWIKVNQKSKHFVKPLAGEKPQVYEPAKVKRKRRIIKMHINLKKVIIGFKIAPMVFDNPKDQNETLIAYTIYISMLFGRTSKYYQQLVNDKIIVANTFSAHHDLGTGYNYLAISADVFNERAFINLVRKAISDEQVCKDKSLFSQKKNANVGKSLRNLESPSDLATEFMDNMMEGMNVFDDIPLIQKMSLKKIEEVAATIRNGDYSVFTIIADKS